MSSINQGLNINNLMGASQSLSRYLPQPASTGVGAFNDVMNVLKTVGSEVIGGVETAVSGDFGDLLTKQLEVQMEMQKTTMVSNLERSAHETKMAAIRNIRVG